MAKSKKKSPKKRSKKEAPKKNKKLKALWFLLLLLPLAALPFLGSTPKAIQDYGFEVIGQWPHDANAYTQGFAFDRGYFYEGTGLYGQSSIRKVDPASGTILKDVRLESRYFGEGIAMVGGTLVQLTWKEEKVFVYNSDTFELLREYETKKEGWGLTYDGTDLVASDGSSRLYFHDKSNFALKRQIEVRDKGLPVKKLNELEYIEGEIWANIWQTFRIVRINPKTGEVVGRIDLSEILKPEDRNGKEDVLNGIAYDPEKKRIFVTGKKYSHIYEIKLIPKRR